MKAGPATGSLLGLAYGDALGAPTEFLAVNEIVAKCGPGGPRELVGDPARVTDDTQMALAVGWALREASTASPETLEPLLRERFVAWSVSPDNNRAPGQTCLAACANRRPRSRLAGRDRRRFQGVRSEHAGHPRRPRAQLRPRYAGRCGAAAGGPDHGHPTALAASELTAYAVRLLRDGAAFDNLPALLRARCREQRSVHRHDWLGGLWRTVRADKPGDFIARGWDECLTAPSRLDAALAHPDDGGDPCRLTGQGWIAEEALVTGLLCALREADDPVGALARAATTSGDSDSIACLTGAFLGAAYGTAAWSPGWAGRIEYADQLAALGAGWDTGRPDHAAPA